MSEFAEKLTFLSNNVFTGDQNYKTRVINFRSRVILAFQISYRLAKTVICNFLKDPESYEAAKFSGRPKTKISCIE